MIRYSCNPSRCSPSNGHSRADVLGCLFFCRTDSNGDGQIERSDFYGFVAACASAGTGEGSILSQKIEYLYFDQSPAPKRRYPSLTRFLLKKLLRFSNLQFSTVIVICCESPTCDRVESLSSAKENNCKSGEQFWNENKRILAWFDHQTIPLDVRGGGCVMKSLKVLKCFIY